MNRAAPPEPPPSLEERVRTELRGMEERGLQVLPEPLSATPPGTLEAVIITNTGEFRFRMRESAPGLILEQDTTPR